MQNPVQSPVAIRAKDDPFLIAWHAYAARLRRVAYRYLRSPDAAADIVQQTFIALWESRDTLEVHTSFPNFLFGAVRNRATNVLAHERVVRRHRADVAAEYDMAVFVAQNTGPQNVEAEELATAVHAILATVPARTREIFLLSRQDGLSPREIAIKLELSPQTVYNQLTRAVRALADGLGRTAR
jgi:RNA polymerase sigma-70 factor (ECF subfamily)